MDVSQETLDSFTLTEEDETVNFLLGLCESEFQLEAFDGHSWYVDPSEVESVHLLKEYRKRLTSDFNVTRIGCSDEQMRETAEKISNHKRKVDARLSTLEYPEKDQWLVNSSVIERIIDLSIPQSGVNFLSRESRRKASWDEWRAVFNRFNTDELQFISKTIREYYKPQLSNISSCTVIDTFRFKKGHDIEIPDIVRMTKRGKGASRSTVIEHTEKTLEALDPVFAGFLMNWLTEIKTNLDSNNNRSGYHSRQQKYINVSSDAEWDWVREKDGCIESTTAHELSHALHYMVQLYEEDTSVDNRGKSSDKWECNINIPEELKDDPVQSYRNVMREQWESFRDGQLDALRSYQSKNFDEFTAVAFETWIVNPDVLKEYQPAVYTAIEQTFSDPRKDCRKTSVFDEERTSRKTESPVFGIDAEMEQLSKELNAEATALDRELRQISANMDEEKKEKLDEELKQMVG